MRYSNGLVRLIFRIARAGGDVPCGIYLFWLFDFWIFGWYTQFVAPFNNAFWSFIGRSCLYSPASVHTAFVFEHGAPSIFTSYVEVQRKITFPHHYALKIYI